MNSETLKKEIDVQYERNLKNWGTQPRGTLILELEDQAAKLRDAFLHRTDNQTIRRLINIGALLWAIAKEYPQ